MLHPESWGVYSKLNSISAAVTYSRPIMNTDMLIME